MTPASPTPMQAHIAHERAARLNRMGVRAPTPTTGLTPPKRFPCNRPISTPWREIAQQCADANDVTFIVMRERNRHKQAVKARQMAFYRLRRELGLSYPRIATLLGMECHTTVIYGERRYAKETGLPL